jgi:hypothetical protein
MQNTQTLIELGFQKNLHGEYFWRGKSGIFVGKPVNYNGPIEYVDLYKVSDIIDMRPHSDRKGRHYQSFIKTCCSDGSVSRSLKKYDI